MIISFLKRHSFFASFLLSTVSPVITTAGWGMLTEEQLKEFNRSSQYSPENDRSKDQQKKKSFYLMQGITSFENKDWNTAAGIFTYLRNNGALIPSAYLQYMEDNHLIMATLPSEHAVPFVFEPIPEIGKKMSESFLTASLAWITYQSSIDEKAKKESFKNIADMSAQGNAHALSLFRKAYEENNTVLGYLQANHHFKTIKSLLDLYQKFTPDSNGNFKIWNYLGPSHLYFFCVNKKISHFKNKLIGFSDKELNYFFDHYGKKPHLIGGIAAKLAKAYPKQPLWAYLAFENGMNEGCANLSEFYFSQMLPSSTSQAPVHIKNNARCFFRYYLSHMQMDPELIYDFGVRLREKNDLNESRKCFKMSADLGNFRAQYEFALMCYQGTGGKKDIHEALRYSKKAADQGFSQAQYNYAYFLEHEVGGYEDLVEARKYYKMSADQGFSDAQCNYSLMCEKGRGGEKNLEEAHFYVKKAADQGNRTAQHNCAHTYEQMQSELKDQLEARKHYKMSADQGDPDAQFRYGLMCEEGRGGGKDLGLALRYYKKAADQGLSEAQFNYADIRFKGRADLQNPVEARKYYKMSADQGYSQAQFNYAVMCHQGTGGKKDLDQARKYFKMAADQDHEEAQYAYANVCHQVLGEDQDLAEIRIYYKRAADHGHLKAQFNYAVMCHEGTGGKKDLDQARKYSKMAADQRDASAQYIYGCTLYYGEGGDQDLSEAYKYFKVAAEQGNGNAQYAYASMCLHGKGGDQNLVDARSYYKISAHQGIQEAQYNYALMCYEGTGGGKDLDQAFHFFKMSADQGYVMAQLLYAELFCDIEGPGKNLQEAQRYYQMAADQGSFDAFVRLYFLNFKINQSELKKSLLHKIDNKQSYLEITLSPMEEATDSSDEEDFSSLSLISKTELTISQQSGQSNSANVMVNKGVQEDKEILSYAEKPEKDMTAEEKILSQELHEYGQDNEQAYAKSRLIKRDAAARTRHKLIMNENDYAAPCKKFEMATEMIGQKKKTNVSPETMDFVNAIFGQGKINTYSNTKAKKAFAELGCAVTNKKGENSTALSFSTTSLSFDLEENRRMELDYQEVSDQEDKNQKVKYHNPHGHGDNNLYNALKPHLKRFLTSINKTPETLQVK